MSLRMIAGLLVVAVGLLLLGALYSRPTDDSGAQLPAKSGPITTVAEPAHAPPDTGAVDSAQRIDQAQTPNPKTPVQAKAKAAQPANTPQSQRAQVRARLHTLMACQPSPVPTASDRELVWRMTLPPEAIARAPAQYAAAEAWAGQACAQTTMRLSPTPADSGGVAGLWSELAPDDALRRLWEASATDDLKREDAPAMRTLLEQALAEALREPSMLELQWIADTAWRFQNRGAQLGPYIGYGESGSALWRLAACDLGADCGPNSPAAHLICFQEQLCGYGSVEEALIDAYWPLVDIERLQAGREALVARLRAGGQGVFDPVTPDGG